MANAATLKPLQPQLSTASQTAPTTAPVRRHAMLSHPGRVRSVNQDACAALPAHGAYVVCDGVGGAAAGEVASLLASEAFLNSLAHPARATKAQPPDSAPAQYPPDHPHTRLQRAVQAANHAVFQRAQRARALHGMGTTLVAALWDRAAVPDAPQSVWLAHVGDSRTYRFRKGVLTLLTVDHSLVEEQVRAGQLSRAQAEISPIRNIITRAVGADAQVEPEIAAHDTQPGDLLLLASDGLTRELDDAAIAHTLARTSASAPANTSANLDAACQALVDAANAHGGRDNITVLLIACP
jgi:protein phosphatase